MSRLKKSEASVKPGQILLGYRFAILNGTDIDRELPNIAEWVATPSEVDRPWNIFETLTFNARQARRTDIRLPVGWMGRFGQASPQLDKNWRLIGIMGAVLFFYWAC